MGGEGGACLDSRTMGNTVCSRGRPRPPSCRRTKRAEKALTYTRLLRYSLALKSQGHAHTPRTHYLHSVS
eukprot:5089710-Pleurochrysis_carterae.AAC.1